jgi:hypothetical protein
MQIFHLSHNIMSTTATGFSRDILVCSVCPWCHHISHCEPTWTIIIYEATRKNRTCFKIPDTYVTYDVPQQQLPWLWVFWVETTGSLVDWCQHFTGACCLQLWPDDVDSRFLLTKPHNTAIQPRSLLTWIVFLTLKIVNAAMLLLHHAIKLTTQWNWHVS